MLLQQSRFLVLVGVVGLCSASVLAHNHNKPINLLNTLPIAEKAYSDFLPVMQNNANQTRQEKGNISFDVFVSEDGGSTIYLFEQWQNKAALERHMQTEHLQAVANKVGNAMVTGKSETSERLRKLTTSHEPKSIESPQSTRNVIVTVEVKPEYREKIMTALIKLADHARSAQGNIRFDVYQRKNNTNSFVVFERWQSESTHEQHLAQDYNQELAQLMKKALVKPIESGRLLLRDVS